MRLIDADELLKDSHQHYNYLAAEWYVRVRDIEDAPTIEERKKGFWEWVDDMDYRCSNCQNYVYGCLGEVLSGHYKYCPFCGCAMEGEEDDAETD